MIQTTVLPKHS